MTVYALHENPEWWPPFAAAFDAEGVDVEQWLLTGDGELDLGAEPPVGVFWSRMSASAHTRGHVLAKEQTRAVLSWLEGWGRTVVNGRGVLELEMSKVAQHAALRAAGVDVPRTSAVLGRDRLVPAAERFAAEGGGAPFVTKHDQGGKGLGVRRFEDPQELRAALDAGELEPPANGVWLLQELLVAAEPAVTRTEIVAGEHVYSVRVSTAQGFELCPADACALPGQEPLFALREGYEPPLLDAYRRFLDATGTAVAGIESIETVDGRVVTYDVNTNTNYNAEVEAVAPRSGPRAIARHLGRLDAFRG
ncbi:alpha-L-glutamate ligase [Pseudokineococcus basanitobsidens]|uniref:Alpha-L-glutamate ligase n=1 Tax=Pseudokineococcus basanitobsidens TaxID=1926649 RepID=A0ABU8RGN4_9ACTN